MERRELYKVAESLSCGWKVVVNMGGEVWTFAPKNAAQYYWGRQPTAREATVAVVDWDSEQSTGIFQAVLGRLGVRQYGKFWTDVYDYCVM